MGIHETYHRRERGISEILIDEVCIELQHRGNDYDKRIGARKLVIV
jgi:hypothetical protein